MRLRDDGRGNKLPNQNLVDTAVDGLGFVLLVGSCGLKCRFFFAAKHFIAASFESCVLLKLMEALGGGG